MTPIRSLVSFCLLETGSGEKMGNINDIAVELREFPEFQSIEAFVESKMDDGDIEFSTAELVALSLNAMGPEAHIPSQHVTQRVKFELETYGMKFVGQLSQHRSGAGSIPDKRAQIAQKIRAPERVDTLNPVKQTKAFDPGIPPYQGKFIGHEVPFSVPIWRRAMWMITDPDMPRMSRWDKEKFAKSGNAEFGRRWIPSYLEGKYIWNGRQWIKRMPTLGKSERPRLVETRHKTDEATWRAKPPKQWQDKLPQIDVEADDSNEAGEKASDAWFEKHAARGIDPMTVDVERIDDDDDKARDLAVEFISDDLNNLLNDAAYMGLTTDLIDVVSGNISKDSLSTKNLGVFHHLCQDWPIGMLAGMLTQFDARKEAIDKLIGELNVAKSGRMYNFSKIANEYYLETLTAAANKLSDLTGDESIWKRLDLRLDDFDLGWKPKTRYEN